MGRAALKASGVEPSEIDRVEREYRLRDCERLERQAETGDLHAGLGTLLRAGPRASRREAADRPSAGRSTDNPRALRRSLDDVPVRPVAAPHVDMRFGVGRPPFLGRGARALPSDRRCGAAARVSRRDVRSARMSTGASSQMVIARSLSSLRVRGSTIGAAAGRDHADVALDQPRDQPPLAVAEILLAIALEHLGGRKAGRILDLGVAVDERQAEPLGQPAADRRLARPPSARPARSADRDAWPVPSSLRGYTAACRARQKPPPCPRTDCAHHRRSLLIIGGARSSCRRAPKEQPTQTIEVAVPSQGGNAH